MTRRKRTAPEGTCQEEFAESTITVSCPHSVQRKMRHSLQQAAHYHIFPDRAKRARQILEQIKAEQAAAERRRHIEQLTAVALPSPSPAPERQTPPDRIRRGRQVFATVRHWGRAAARRVMGIYSRIHGCSVAGQPGPGRRSKRLVTR